MKVHDRDIIQIVHILVYVITWLAKIVQNNDTNNCII